MGTHCITGFIGVRTSQLQRIELLSQIVGVGGPKSTI